MKRITYYCSFSYMGAQQWSPFLDVTRVTKRYIFFKYFVNGSPYLYAILNFPCTLHTKSENNHKNLTLTSTANYRAHQNGNASNM